MIDQHRKQIVDDVRQILAEHGPFATVQQMDEAMTPIATSLAAMCQREYKGEWRPINVGEMLHYFHTLYSIDHPVFAEDFLLTLRDWYQNGHGWVRYTPVCAVVGQPCTLQCNTCPIFGVIRI